MTKWLDGVKLGDSVAFRHIPVNVKIQYFRCFATKQQKQHSQEPQLSCAKCKKKGTSLPKCSGCGAVAYCNAQCQKAHWVLHKPDCTRIKKEKKEREKEKEKEKEAKAKEAARGIGSGSGLGDMGSLMVALMPPPQPQRYDEEDLWRACGQGKHDEVDKALRQKPALDVNWAVPNTGFTAAIVSAQNGTDKCRPS